MKYNLAMVVFLFLCSLAYAAPQFSRGQHSYAIQPGDCAYTMAENICPQDMPVIWLAREINYINKKNEDVLYNDLKIVVHTSNDWDIIANHYKYSLEDIYVLWSYFDCSIDIECIEVLDDTIVLPEDPQPATFSLADGIAVNGESVEGSIIDVEIISSGNYYIGEKIVLPDYKRVQTHRTTFYLRNWYYAVRAGYLFDIDPALIIAIHCHENPNPAREDKACGVLGLDNRGRGGGHMPVFRRHMAAKGYSINWQTMWGTNMKRQYYGCAYVVGHLILDDRGAWNLGSGDIYSYRSYAEGSTSWARNVWAIYQEASR